jgi:dipeptidase D
MKIDGLTTASSNVGILRTQADYVTAECNTRGALWSYVDDMEQEQEFLCARCGIDRKVASIVPVFDYIENSAMRALLQKVFKQVTGRELQPIAVHGGLEAGYFRRMYPDMDIVTIGPLDLDEHMATERLSLKSFDEIYKVVLEMLKNM